MSTLKEAISLLMDELLETEEALSHRLDKAMFYEGVFHEGQQYNENSVVTDKGTLWIALRSTVSRPPSEDWRLMVKTARGGAK